jgi:pyrroline-5-carboxylate reductase
MNICFIGGGNMASAMIGGLIKRGDFTVAQIRVVDPNPNARMRLQQEFKVQTTDDLALGIKDSGTIILAVKPDQIREVVENLSIECHQDEKPLIISIAAGVNLASIARWLGWNHPPIIRAMPNTPALICEGITGLYPWPKVLGGITEKHIELADKILRSIGETVWVNNEDQMNAVTAVSGSGPAYFFYFIEALEQAGKELGLPEQTARKLALVTAFGAAKLARESAEDPATLRARVTSKNGTTERALLNMEEKIAGTVKQRIITAANAAAARSREMGDELGKA